MTKTQYIGILVLLALVAAVPMLVNSLHTSSFLGGASFRATFSSVGTTNATSSVGSKSTQVLGNNWYSFAVISNPSTSTISCFLDNKTAASSSVVSNAGYVLGASNAQTNVSPSYLELGNCSGFACVPYIGAVNCVANVTTTVGVIYN